MRGLLSIALAATIALGNTACGGAAPSDAPREDPLVIGPVESISHRATASGILVGAGPRAKDACGIAATVDSTTRYLRRGGDGTLATVSIADVGVGDTVEIYTAGPVAESCPLQGRAATIVIR